MKRKIYVLIMIISTIITTSIIISFHPDKNSIAITKRYFELIEKAGDGVMELVKAEEEDINVEEDFVINDEVFERFLDFYSDKKLEDLEIYEREEARYILESMGFYNTTKLRDLLQEEEPNEEEIYQLLNENLFDYDLIKLERLLQ